LLDRSQPVTFSFNGETLQGFEGDTLASALLANDKVMVGRSYKYHRPRGILASGAEEPNALMGVGEGPRFEPNQRATTTELFHGLTAQSQNHWPSLNFDVGGINNKIAALAPVFSAGFYYKTFMFPRAAWKHVYEPIVRNAAGLGKTPNPGDPDAYEHFHAFCDVLVIGGGLAGLAAARAAAEAGARVMLVEQTAHWGGRANTETDIEIDGQPAADWARAQVTALEGMKNVTLRSRAMASGLYDHGYALVYERVSDHRPGQPGAPRHRLWRVRAKRTIVATGALERPLAFANNDTPGVMLAGAVRDYVRLWGVLPGRKAVVCANNDDAYRTAIALHEAGAKVAAVLDTRAQATGTLPDQVRALQIPVRGHRQGHRGQAGHRGRDRPHHRHRPDGRPGRKDRLRRGRNVRRLVAGSASLLPLRRQAGLGCGSGDVPTRPCTRRAHRTGRGGQYPLRRDRERASRHPRGAGRRHGGGARGGRGLRADGRWFCGPGGLRARHGPDRRALVHPCARQIRPWHKALRRLPERCHRRGCAPGWPRGLRERRAHQALHHHGHGDRSG
jgi:NADPH-dependent 2,4-dienoyl-CoA reductase/sulfur reductase-like enzyme